MVAAGKSVRRTWWTWEGKQEKAMVGNEQDKPGRGKTFTSWGNTVLRPPGHGSIFHLKSVLSHS